MGRMLINIRFQTPAKLRSGDYLFKYWLLRPGEAQKRGLFIQIFAFSPRHSSNAGSIHPNTRFYAPVQPKTLKLYRQTYLNPHKTNHAQRNPTKYCRITLRVIFISYQSNCQHKKVNTDNLSASTSTTAQIFDANQIQIYPIRRYRIRKLAVICLINRKRDFYDVFFQHTTIRDNT